MKERTNNKMKIAVSILSGSHGIFKDDDGITVRARRIAGLLRESYNVTLIGKDNEKQELRDIITIKTRKKLLWNFELVPVIIKNRFDCIYCVGDLFAFLTYFLLSKIYRYKIIFDATGNYSELKMWPRSSTNVYKILEKFVIKHADHVTAIAGYVFNFYQKYNKNIDLLPLFIDENIFKRSESQSKENAKKNSKSLGMIGPFAGPFVSLSNKYYLDFFSDNSDKFDNKINFVLIGRCDNKIESERITYTGYLDSIKDYVDQLSSLDAVLLLHKPEDPGPYTKIIESMSCALPVFTTPKGIFGLDYVTHGKDILVFEEEELIDKVNELIFDDELMKEIGNNARITVEKYYSKKANKKKLINIIEALNANK